MHSSPLAFLILDPHSSVKMQGQRDPHNVPSQSHEMSINNNHFRSSYKHQWLNASYRLDDSGRAMPRAGEVCRPTYNDVLSGLEGADVVGVVHVIHLLQDGGHAG